MDGELAALWDRFDLRYEVSYIKNERNFTDMLRLNGATIMTSISFAELTAAQNKANQVIISDTTINALTHLWKELRNQGFLISDRRFRNCLRFLKAHAWLEGRSKVVEDDIVILTHMLWTEPQQKKSIKKIVLGFANPLVVKANEIYDSATELQPKIKEMSEGPEKTTAATEANHKLKVAAKMLGGLIHQAQQEGKNAAKVEERLKQVKEMNEAVVNEFLLGI